VLWLVFAPEHGAFGARGSGLIYYSDTNPMNVKPYHRDRLAEGYHHKYLIPELLQLLREERAKKIFDLGCGNGFVADLLDRKGYDVTGVDPSDDKIQIARQFCPHLKVYPGSAYDDLAAVHGKFPIVISLEVVEHVYDPRSYATTLYSLVTDGGVAVVSSPYHGYWKNLALALAGRMDKHYSPLRLHGHIKFWSMDTLSSLLRDVGFKRIEFRRVGRIAPLAKSMIAIARK
jgi:2-polyprenyl-3-methyl-5-hydroxy-6-metoxy-1,4-benzoquinol methylase